MRVHESKRFPGAFVASLSIPWGFARGDQATGGYHVVWPRDLAETALGLLAAGDAKSARRSLAYLHATQEGDGKWTQNMWLDGTAHWDSIQMDGTGFAILLADALRRSEELGNSRCWPMIQAAATFLISNGPVTDQDRWEEIAGYSPYTMAVEIAALLAAADFADIEGERKIADFLRATADSWNDAIDELTYATGTKLCKKHRVNGYYFRLLPSQGIRAKTVNDVDIELKNHPRLTRTHKAVEIISPDALALVRFGLRSAHDERIANTVQMIDATLKTDTSTGPVWHRYSYDAYGEHADGTPFDGRGKGRGWPLLASERAHYEIARGRFEVADELRRTMEAQTSECGMIPEQIWDA
jgi:glucoamylase